MPRTGTPSLFTIIFLASICACQSNAPDLPVLDKVKIEGNKELNDREIESKLALKSSSWIPFFGEKTYYDASVLPQDLLRVERIYETKGYYGSKVTNHQVDTNNKEVNLTIWVDEGKAVRIENLTLDGFPSTLPAPELLLEKGGKFDEASYNTSKALIRTSLRENGYPYAEVEGKVTIDPANYAADLRFLIKAGILYRIGRIDVRGTETTDAAMLRDLTGLEPGTLFQESKFERAQRNLYEMGIFRLVEVRLGEANVAEGTVPVVVNVDEGPFHTLGVGAGVGLENQRQEVRARLQYNHGNFLGKLRRLETEIRPAYIFVPGIQDPQQRGFGGQAKASLFQPEFLYDFGMRDLGWSNSLELNRDLQDGFIVTTGAARSGFIWPTDTNYPIEAGYNFEVFNLANLPAEVSQCKTVCKISFLDQKFVADMRDNRTNPRSGYWASLGLQEAGLGGDFRYVRVVPEARGYHTVHEDITLAVRAQVGVMMPEKGTDSPIPKRFYAGGATNHRGFGLRRLSPQIYTSGRRRGIPIGGNSLATTNLEARYLIKEDISAIVFFDAGDVRDHKEVFDHPHFNPASGLGFRYETPVVPIRLDAGYRLTNPERFRQEPRLALHLTLGDAF